MSYGNVRTILDRIGVKIEHAPQDREYRAALLDIVNRWLGDVSTEQPWRFLQTEADFKVWQERNYTFTGFTATVVANSTTVTFSGSLGTEFALLNAGMTFDDGLGNALTSTYTIGRFTSVSGSTCVLTSPYLGADAVLTTWTIGNDKVLLPLDCAQPLGFIDRATGRGRLISWDRRREELYLSPMGPGQTGDVWWVVDGDTPYDRPPDSTFTGALDTASGTLTASSIYQYAYTFSCEGRESPPSIIVEVETGSGATNRIILSGIENTETSGALSVGRRKNVYRRQVTSGSTTINGPWLLMTAVQTESGTTYTDDGSVTPTHSDSSAMYYEGPAQFMRPKSTPASDAILRIRYLQRAKKLVSDADVPTRWPGEYIDLLVLYAAMDKVGSNSEMSKSRDWERAANAMKKRMVENWVQVADLPTQKQSWGVGPFPTATVKCGTVTSDFGS